MTALELATYISRDEIGFFCYTMPNGDIVHSREQMTLVELEEHCLLCSAITEESMDYEESEDDVNESYSLGLPHFNYSF